MKTKQNKETKYKEKFILVQSFPSGGESNHHKTAVL